jgi:hypothetical protein
MGWQPGGTTGTMVGCSLSTLETAMFTSFTSLLCKKSLLYINTRVGPRNLLFPSHIQLPTPVSSQTHLSLSSSTQSQTSKYTGINRYPSSLLSITSPTNNTISRCALPSSSLPPSWPWLLLRARLSTQPLSLALSPSLPPASHTPMDSPLSSPRPTLSVL